MNVLHWPLAGLLVAMAMHAQGAATAAVYMPILLPWHASPAMAPKGKVWRQPGFRGSPASPPAT